MIIKFCLPNFDERPFASTCQVEGVGIVLSSVLIGSFFLPLLQEGLSLRPSCVLQTRFWKVFGSTGLAITALSSLQLCPPTRESPPPGMTHPYEALRSHYLQDPQNVLGGALFTSDFTEEHFRHLDVLGLHSLSDLHRLFQGLSLQHLTQEQRKALQGLLPQPEDGRPLRTIEGGVPSSLLKGIFHSLESAELVEEGVDHDPFDGFLWLYAFQLVALWRAKEEKGGGVPTSQEGILEQMGWTSQIRAEASLFLLAQTQHALEVGYLVEGKKVVLSDPLSPGAPRKNKQRAQPWTPRITLYQGDEAEVLALLRKSGHFPMKRGIAASHPVEETIASSYNYLATNQIGTLVYRSNYLAYLNKKYYNKKRLRNIFIDGCLFRSGPIQGYAWLSAPLRCDLICPPPPPREANRRRGFAPSWQGFFNSLRGRAAVITPFSCGRGNEGEAGSESKELVTLIEKALKEDDLEEIVIAIQGNPSLFEIFQRSFESLGWRKGSDVEVRVVKAAAEKETLFQRPSKQADLFEREEGVVEEEFSSDESVSNESFSEEEEAVIERL